jgi:hypothetical protein
LNVVLSYSGLENVDEEDDNHIEECDEADNNLRTNTKILTKYVVKPYFYNVILRKIF